MPANGTPNSNGIPTIRQTIPNNHPVISDKTLISGPNPYFGATILERPLPLKSDDDGEFHSLILPDPALQFHNHYPGNPLQPPPGPDFRLIQKHRGPPIALLPTTIPSYLISPHSPGSSGRSAAWVSSGH